MTLDRNLSDRLSVLNELAMVYETGVNLFSEKDYLNEFYDFYEIRSRKEKLIPSPCGFEETLKDVSGDDCWKPIADKTKSLFGIPRRVMVFENVRNLQKSGAPKKKKPRRKTADSAENAVTVENSVPMNNTVSAGYTLPTEYPYSVGYTTPTVYTAGIENSASANQDAQEQPNPAGYTSGDFEENK